METQQVIQSVSQKWKSVTMRGDNLLAYVLSGSSPKPKKYVRGDFILVSVQFYI